jgi:hypothetical protein
MAAEPDPGRSHGTGSIAVAAVGIVSTVIAAGLVFEVPPITNLWPFPVSLLTYEFLGSVVLAFAVPILWIAWTGDLGAAAGAGMTAAAAAIGIGLALLPRVANESRLLTFAAGGIGLGIVALSATAVALRRPFRDPRGTPPVVRLALAAFAVLLVAAGALITLGVPNVLPWQIDGQNAALVGWIFISDAAYFAYGATRPFWANAAGQLMAFAAYDIVLLPPLVAHFSNVIPEQRTSLIIYVAVLLISLAVAVFAFLVQPATRIWQRQSIR